MLAPEPIFNQFNWLLLSYNTMHTSFGWLLNMRHGIRCFLEIRTDLPPSAPDNLGPSLRMLLHASCGVLGYLCRAILLNDMFMSSNPFSDRQGLKLRGCLKGGRMLNPQSRSQARS